MGSNLSNNSPIAKPAPQLQGKARVDLVKSDFDALVWQKGYDVLLDKAIKCPCRNIPDNQALSDCKNCGGSGWVFINRTKTRMVIQAMNRDTQYKEWSEELLGTAKLTTLENEHLSYMDRITISNATQTVSQTVHFETHSDNKVRARAYYPILNVHEVFLFDQSNVPLIKAIEGEHFVIKDNWIELTDQHNHFETLSIRYDYNPSYHIIDHTRAMLTTKVIKQGRDVDTALPVSAVAKLAHYVLDEENYNNQLLFDNSYTEQC